MLNQTSGGQLVTLSAQQRLHCLTRLIAGMTMLFVLYWEAERVLTSAGRLDRVCIFQISTGRSWSGSLTCG